MRKIILVLFMSAVFLTPLIIVPFTLNYYNTPKELFVQLIITLCFMLWLIKGIMQEKFEIFPIKLYSPLLIFCLILGLSILWAKNTYLVLKDYVPMVTYVIAFAICVNFVSQKFARSAAVFAITAGVICAIYAHFQYLGLDFIKYPGIDFPDWRFRLYSTFGNPDFLANYLILIFPVGIVIYSSTGVFLKKFLMLVALGIIYSALLISFSIGALLGLLVGILLMISLFIAKSVRFEKFLTPRSPPKHLGKSIAVLVALLGVITVFFFVPNKFHSPSILREAQGSSVWKHGLDNRLIVYKSAYEMAKDRPFLGVGLGNFKLEFPKYRGDWLGEQHQYVKPELLDRERDKNVLNEFLQLFAETGVFGFAWFIFIVAIIFKTGVVLYYSTSDQKRQLFILGLIGGISAFLVHSLLSFPMHVVPNAFLFWVFVGLLFTQSAQQHRTSIILYLGPVKKRLVSIAVFLLAISSCIWPIRIYLSEVFLKKMVFFNAQGAVNEALEAANRSIAFSPHSNAVSYIASYAQLSGDDETATFFYEEALKTQDTINFHMALAELYYKKGLVGDCIKQYKQAVRLNPLSPNLRFRLANLYVEKGMYKEAEAECQFILMSTQADKNTKSKVQKIIRKIFNKTLSSGYYGKVQISE
ncbi:MAG: O-antigen ligase family protein [Candidatus Omnitrophica bacterium]|nr:O-antigen ligase family protein [Candidatus Omnitrophota bacterium]